MTLPIEHKWAIDNTRKFLFDLMDPRKTPRVPMDIRREARRCLKHYPGEYHMEQAQLKAPEVFGEYSG